MIKTVNVNKLSEVRVVDTFRPAVMNINGGDPSVDIHFGPNMDILVLTAHNKQISKDNLTRIKILTEEKG